MNFYQRTNLSMSLAILFGLELAISNYIRISGESLTLQAAIYPLVWVCFQFIFRLKATIDDHDHFKAEGTFSSATNVRKLLNFFFLSISGFLYVLSAIFSFDMAASGGFFLLAIIIATIWVIFEKKSIFVAWFWINVVYVLLVAAILFDWFFFKNCQYVPYISLIIMVCVDVFVSKSHAKMPSLS